MADDRHDRIRQRAHAIWEQEGRPEGAHERHWRQAENEVAAQDADAVKEPAAKPGRAKAGAAPKAEKPAAKAKAAARPRAAAAKKG